MPEFLKYILLGGIGYLLGSICVAMIVSWRQAKLDIRQVGSKSAGASNVLRTLGTKSAAITFLGDFLKVFIAGLIGLIFAGEQGGMVAALFAVIGHNWPIYYGFKGGKGVAGSVGAMLLLFPIEALIAIAICILVIYLTRFISLGSMVLLSLFAVLVCIARWGDWFTCIWAILLALLCIYRHRANIQRMIKGEERKISFKKKTEALPTEES